jgi:hypothetical protein
MAWGEDDLDDVQDRSGKRRKFTLTERIEIGQRDNWLCGICQDTARPVERPPAMLLGEVRVEELVAEDVPPWEEIPEQVGRLPRRPLSASIDHIMPRAAGGTDDRDNLQLAHLFCNLEKNESDAASRHLQPKYMRAKLANLIDGTPIPEELHRGRFPSWAYPARRHTELMIALYIDAGEVAADPRYGDPASRSELFIRGHDEHRWRDSVVDIKERRAKWRARWGLGR